MRGSIRTMFVAGFAVLAVAIVAIAAAPAGFARADPAAVEQVQELVSPNGRFTLRLEANDDAAGLWVYDKKKGELAALYVTDHDGPVVGIGDPAQRPGGWPAALVRDPDGGRLQLVKSGTGPRDGDVTAIGVTQLKKLAALLE